MKNTYKIMLGMSLALTPLAMAQDAPATAVAPAATAAPAPTAAEVKELFSYLMGYQYGQQMAQQASALLLDDYDQAVFFKAFADGLKNEVDAVMKEKDVAAHMQMFEAMLKERQGAQGAINKKAGEEFLAANASKEGVKTTESGLQYKVITAGDGAKHDEAKDGKSAIAKVSYEGRLIDGRVFDASTEPVEFPIDAVVPGFSEALKMMPAGSEWEVYLPSNLAYGENGPGILGSNATLIFKLKLHSISPAKGKAGNPIEMTPEILEQLKAQGMQPVGQ